MNQNTSSLGVLGWLAQMLISIFRMVTKSMSVVENTVNMAHKSVEVAAEEQTIELTVKRKDMRKRITDAASLKIAQQEEIMQEYGRKSPEHKNMLDAIRKDLDAEIDKALLHSKSN